MRKAILMLILSSIIAGTCFSQSSIDIARRLHDLQNEIVEKSFKQLEPFAWADYIQQSASGNQTHFHVVYLGQKLSYHMQGQKFYVVEIRMGQASGQIWYRLDTKDLEGHMFFTLEPMEIYARMGNRLVYINKDMIEFFMSRSGAWSTILQEGIIMNPPDLSVKVDLENILFNFPSGKRVKAVKIKSPESGSFVIVSSDVPFGMIESKSTRTPAILRMISYGTTGGASRFSESDIRNAKSMFSLSFPFGK